MADDNNGNNSADGGNSLGGGAREPLPSSWNNRPSGNARIGRIGQPSSSSSGPARSGPGRFATLNDITSSGPSRGRAARPPSDDSDEDDGGPDEERESWFAGGERSGLSIEGPGRPHEGGPGSGTIRDILKKAAQGGPPPAQTSQHSSGGRFFSGGGNTLGSEDMESTYIPDPTAPPPGNPAELELAIRQITFWRDGFTIQDGPLLRYDVPENEETLNSINTGNAPPSVLNVQIGQPVELRVSRRINEDYVASPKRFGAFEGSGNRLGSPLPPGTPDISLPSSTQIPGAFPTTSSSSPSEVPTEPVAIAPKFEVNMDAPHTNVQIRLADGTRLRSRMNLTHTVGDIRGFINASRPGLSSTPYSIGTTFPNRTLDDDAATIEAAGLQNSVIVQRIL